MGSRESKSLRVPHTGNNTLFNYKRVPAVAIDLMTEPVMRPNMMRLAMDEGMPRRSANRGTRC